MTTRIYLRDENDPLKDMGLISHSEDGSRMGTYELPWYFEENERVLGFDAPNDTHGETMFVNLTKDWREGIIGRTPVIVSPSGVYQFPHIVVSKIEEST